ncbi:GIY-YIG nuclease family protein [Mesorhizobium sp. M0078]|uniref:GIY-YIG nuclease family protein n=1 Tax=Mesorhizobium sp. M0078 TaxID=2956871 RepID=UPI0033397AF4
MYLLESTAAEGERYIGITTDLKRRLVEHNAGKSSHTSKFLPWRIVSYMAFSNQAKAASFERYLKSGSGHASPTSPCGDGRITCRKGPSFQ